MNIIQDNAKRFDVSYYDQFYEMFLVFKTFDTLEKAQQEVDYLISPDIWNHEDIVYDIDWMDEDCISHKNKYVLTENGWEVSQEY